MKFRDKVLKKIHSRLYNPRHVQICPKFCNMSYRPITLCSAYVETHLSLKNFTGN